jgi:hypothetical protein
VKESVDDNAASPSAVGAAGKVVPPEPTLSDIAETASVISSPHEAHACLR